MIRTATFDRFTEDSPAVHRADWRFLLTLSALAFIVRLLAIVVLTGLNAPPGPNDDTEYDTYAWNLAQGHGYSGSSPDFPYNHLTAWRPPTASVYYAGIYWTFGHRYPVAHIANCLLSALTLLLVYAIAWRSFDRKAARWAALLFALYPFSIYFNLSLVSETLACFLVCLFAYCCLLIKGRYGSLWAAASGATLGALLLCKPAFVLLVPLFPIWAWVVCRQESRLWLRVGVIPVVAGLVLTPWILRNRTVFRATVPFSTMGGRMLLMSNNRFVVSDPGRSGAGIWDTNLPEYAAPIEQTPDEASRDHIASRLALQWLGANRDKWLYLVKSRLLRLWAPISRTKSGQVMQLPRWKLMQLALCTYYAGVMLLCIGSAFTSFRRFVLSRDPALILHLLILTITSSALFFWGMHRYRFPIDGLCIVFAGASLASLGSRVSHSSLRSLSSSIVRRSALARPAVMALGTALIVGFAVLWWTDDQHIETYRNQECLKRLDAIRQAVGDFRLAHGRMPSSVQELVPEFLPNLDALHCPNDSLEVADDHFLRTTDTIRGERVISYALLAPRHAGENLIITETHTTHFGVTNRLVVPMSGAVRDPKR